MLIKEMASKEKPRERLLIYGKENISNEELLAIIIRTGTKNMSSKMVASKILSEFGSIEKLKNANIKKLKEIKGMGLVKSVELLASIELGRRVFGTMPIKDERLNSASLVFAKFKDLFGFENQEVFYALYFDAKQRLIEYKMLFKGTLNYTTVHPREIFKNAFLLSASSVVIIHNHPSGDVTPSEPDVEVTRRVSEVGKVMGIPLVDHIIIGKDEYYSFYENRNK